MPRSTDTQRNPDDHSRGAHQPLTPQRGAGTTVTAEPTPAYVPRRPRGVAALRPAWLRSRLSTRVMRLLWASNDTFEVVDFVCGAWEAEALAL
jgi:hypothetical protein